MKVHWKIKILIRYEPDSQDPCRSVPNHFPGSRSLTRAVLHPANIQLLSTTAFSNHPCLQDVAAQNLRSKHNRAVPVSGAQIVTSISRKEMGIPSRKTAGESSHGRNTLSAKTKVNCHKHTIRNEHNTPNSRFQSYFARYPVMHPRIRRNRRALAFSQRTSCRRPRVSLVKLPDWRIVFTNLICK